MRILLLLATTLRASDYTNDFVIEFDKELDHEGLENFAAQHGLIHKGLILDKYHHFSHSRIRRRSTFETDYDFGSQVKWSQQQRVKSRQKRDFVVPRDPLWPDMWYMNPDYESKGVKRNKDETRHMNITFAWQLGYTGKDVVVSILDDGPIKTELKWNIPI